jgi:hypothetical protein
MTGDIETSVVQAVADAKETDPMDLDCPLYEYIDFGAIRQLADREDTSWTLSFELPDHDVTVTSDGVVQVDEIRQQLWA